MCHRIVLCFGVGILLIGCDHEGYKNAPSLNTGPVPNETVATENPSVPSLNTGPVNNSPIIPLELQDIQHAIEVVCKKARSCGWQTDMAECAEELGTMFTLLPDPDGFAQCIKTMSCWMISEEALLKKVMACAGVSMDSFMCVDEETLRVCNVHGMCKTASCRKICQLYGDPGGTCRTSSLDSEIRFSTCHCSSNQPIQPTHQDAGIKSDLFKFPKDAHPVVTVD